MDNYIDAFKEEVIAHSPKLSEEEWHSFAEKLTPVTFKKGETIFPYTEVCKHVLFLYKGLAASEYQKNHEIGINRFFKPLSLCTNLVSLITEKIFSDRLFAITEVQGVLIPYKPFFEHFLHSEGIGIYIRKKVLEVLVEDKQLISIKTGSGVKPMLSFLKENYPEVILEAPWKYIASFMGVTPAWLSRTLKKKEINKPS